MHIAYLSLGTNLGEKRNNMLSALNEIENRIGEIISQSDFFETAPWGFKSTNTFLNSAICVKTTLNPLELLDATQEIEKSMGRKHKSSNGIYQDRIIDIDILLFDELQICETRLTIPHPLMCERLFVMQPLNQIAPNLIIPGKNKSVSQVFSSLNVGSLKILV